MNDSLQGVSVTPSVPEPDTRTVNDVITARIAQIRERADEMESKLASMPAELLDLRISDLGVLDIYV
jgi:hypothetical protein